MWDVEVWVDVLGLGLGLCRSKRRRDTLGSRRISVVRSGSRPVIVGASVVWRAMAQTAGVAVTTGAHH